MVNAVGYFYILCPAAPTRTHAVKYSRRAGRGFLFGLLSRKAGGFQNPAFRLSE
jgi:hypothetical protein